MMWDVLRFFGELALWEKYGNKVSTRTWAIIAVAMIALVLVLT